MEYISTLVIPIVIAIVAILMLIPNKQYFEIFVEGARDGISTTVKILPTLVALMVSIKMLSASGALVWLSGIISPVTNLLGIPEEILPLLMTRPFSGSASSASFSNLLSTYGADSIAGFCASIIMGSSDTIVYIMAVYFSSVKIKKTRYAMPVAFFVMLFCIAFASILTRLFY